jgi:hypothetical protein
MELSLSQLGLLIELTEVELAEMKKNIEDTNSNDDLINDSSEHSLQLLALSSTLKTMYKIKWVESEDEMSYELLIDDIHERRFGLKKYSSNLR